MAGRLDYEERREYKKALYQERAEKAEDKSMEHHRRYKQISSVIPMGQPILIRTPFREKTQERFSKNR